MSDTIPMLIDGAWVHGPQPLDVRHPFDGSLVGTTTFASPDQVAAAIDSTAAVAAAARRLPLHVRAEALLSISRAIQDRADEFARVITDENGKPAMWAKAEVGRAVSVFRWAAELTRTWSGEAMRLDTDAAAEGRMAYISQVPKGPVLAISPFNFPLNLVAHKVAPAIAVGAPVLLKPADKTPLTALLLARVIDEVTDLPAGMVNVINVPNDQAAALVEDPRLPIISFTGSGPVGYAIQAQVPDKHVVLELGGNAAVFVADDYASEADLDWAATRIANFSNYQAGQSCIGVQRVYAAASYDDLKAAVVAKVETLATGDPRAEGTFVGPMINEDAAKRVEAWVEEAVAAGATLLTGGTREGTTFAPTVLENVPATAKAVCEEVFGPVLVLDRVADAETAFAAINASKFGLQAGVFTHDIQLAFRAHRELEVGGVIVGDAPSYRADQMPYGGVKESGVGREGVKYAMADFTEERVLVLTGLDL